MKSLFGEVFRPAPSLTLSEWADLYAVVPNTSAEPGRWRTDRVPYLREPMDAVSDPSVREMVVMKPAQTGATVGLIGNAICYWIDVDPAPVIVVQPTQAEGEKWSKEKLQPVLDDTRKIEGKIADQTSRTGDNTIRYKKFAGGYIGVIGAESPRELRSRSVPRILFDERDAYKRSAGEEGDPTSLAEKRSLTFPNAFLLTVSTPLKKGGPTSKLYERSDKRRYYVACPHCGHEQVLRWGGKDEPYGIKWDREEVNPGEYVDRPETAYYLCEANACVIEEHHKTRMVMNGRWIAERPGAPIRGYHFNALISLFPGSNWAKLVEEFLRAKDDPNELQVFVNTVLAEPWEDKVETKVEPSDLEARAEEYVDQEGNRVEVPMGVGVLTAFTDVQHDRLEVLIRGWGARERSWMIAHHRIPGDTATPQVWQQLDVILRRAYRHESGADMYIAAMGVDSGDGERTNEVYDYVRTRKGVWATKGQPARQREPIREAARKNKQGVKLVHIGTHPMKATLFARLGLEWDPERSPPFGYMHFRAQDPEWHNGADAEYYAQFGREVPSRKRLPSGEWVVEWKTLGPNEAIDLEVGVLAMLHKLGPAVRNNLDKFAEMVRRQGEAKRKGKPVQRKRRRRGEVLWSAGT